MPYSVLRKSVPAVAGLALLIVTATPAAAQYRFIDRPVTANNPAPTRVASTAIRLDDETRLTSSDVDRRTSTGDRRSSSFYNGSREYEWGRKALKDGDRAAACRSFRNAVDFYSDAGSDDMARIAAKEASSACDR